MDGFQVAVHAIRNLARLGMGVVSVRWSQLGFGRTSSTSRDQATARNLFGFKDGTANLKAEDTELLRDQLWVQPGDGPDWMTGGSYLVTRKIRMLVETWDRTSLAEQEEIASLRPDLDGRQIMALLDIPPGPAVGRAYSYLLELRIEEGPLGPERAEQVLRQWWAEQQS